MLQRTNSPQSEGAYEAPNSDRQGMQRARPHSGQFRPNRPSCAHGDELKSDYHIVVLPGDGIGIEVIDASLAALDALTSRHDFRLRYDRRAGGAHHYRNTGHAFPDSSMAACEKADAILFGAMGWPDIRYPDGTEIAPQLDLRFRLELYAGVRPARAIPGVPLPLADPRASEIDLVVVRESTEGLFASRGKGVVESDR